MLHDTQLREAEIASGPFPVCGVFPPLVWTLPVNASVHLVSSNLGEAEHAPALGACVNAKGWRAFVPAATPVQQLNLTPGLTRFPAPGANFNSVR